MGVLCALSYLITVFLLIPFPFMPWFKQGTNALLFWFPHDQLARFLSGLLSLTCMSFLGFADDVFNLKWRHKLLLPTLASIPLLMVYAVTYGVTYVVVPLPLQPLFGKLVDLGKCFFSVDMAK